MIIAHSHIDADSGAPGSRRARAAAWLCACALVMSALPAFAAPDRNDGPRGTERQVNQDDRQRQNEVQRPDPRQDEPRAEGPRRQIVQREQPARGENARRSGKLTPDERRDLRRQINEAGIDLYPNTPRR